MPTATCSASTDSPAHGTTLTGSNSPALPPPTTLAAGGQYLANATANAWSIPAVFPSDAEIWDHVTGRGLWLPHLTGPDAFLSDTSLIQVLPGESVFVRAATAATAAGLNLASLALRLCFDHQDHLGSSSVITDESGALVEETANYPFGHPRNSFQPSGLTEPYGFSQKERDAESGLNRVEARYLNPTLRITARTR